MTIWFRTLKTDWFTIRQPMLATKAFVLSSPDHGRMIVTALNPVAREAGIHSGMAIADARALYPSLEVMDDKPDMAIQLLKRIGEWFIRYTPSVSLAPPDVLVLDASGCTHLWGGEKEYLTEIITRLKGVGYTVSAAMADTIGAAWAISHLNEGAAIIEKGKQHAAILNLPPIALRLDPEILERLIKLGLRQVKDFIDMPRTALRRRFGKQLIQRIDQALGQEVEPMELLNLIEVFQERLPCLEPIVTATGIEIALQRLLESLCQRLKQEEKGLRIANLKGFRVDGKIEIVTIQTNRPSHNSQHLFKLFEYKLSGIEPALGIELFILEAPVTEDTAPMQAVLWENNNGLENNSLAELLDRIAGKIGAPKVNRYLPAEHYWPERSYKPAADLQEEPSTTWNAGRPRPLLLLSTPQLIEVTAPIPDYPPMLFRFKGKLYKIVKADGPERIEQEWWVHDGQHRDYYIVEDEQGCRYWVFRSGHYDAGKSYQWYLHGFFS